MASTVPGFMRFVENALTKGARRAWPELRKILDARARQAVNPTWAPGPLVRPKDRSRPPVGWPRRTDSLCPRCVIEVRDAIARGELDPGALLNRHPGEIPASIFQRDGAILMQKRCDRHGSFEEVLSIDPEFTARLERLFPGRDFLAPESPLRQHGKSSVRYGRGAVLTVDLTNRCNMMCDPCFMDANQVGFVHELGWDSIRRILDDSLTVKPRRQMSVQFSGGEPTLSPHFLGAVRYARQAGYFCVQCASNGIRFAQEPDFCRAAKDAGLRLVYLQFDGPSNEAHAHRKVGNLFDVKARAIENLHTAGIDVVLVVTVIKGINDDSVGSVVEFAIANADKITVVSFQPVSFSGRSEDVSDEQRARQRYTLSHLVHDLEDQLGYLEPLRDFFPLSVMTLFSDVVDILLGPQARFGALNCGCHPHCGVGSILLVHKQTKQALPISAFLDVDQLLDDLGRIADSAQPRPLMLLELAIAAARNFHPERAPKGYSLVAFLAQMLSQIGARGSRIGATEGDAPSYPWRFLFVAGMAFQDVYNYDFRRTEMCIIPYGTELGEVSFCAYNTGVGWRSVVEASSRKATLTEWYSTHGRHPVYAKHQNLELPPPASRLGLPRASNKRRLPLVG